MGPEQVDSGHEEWIHRYLWEKSVQEKAHRLIRMKVDKDGNGTRTGSDWNERDLLIKARARLIGEMARWQTSIESNPSSNLVVAGFDTLAAPQGFLYRREGRMWPKVGDGPLPWTISADDPITFSTSLADEYAYAWAGMVHRPKRPYDPGYARASLDEAAATSMRMRFTLPRESNHAKN